MKNTIRFLGIIALVAIIGFSMAACDNGSGDNGGDGGRITIDGWSWWIQGDESNKGISTITMTQGTGNDSKKLTFTGNIQQNTNAGIGGYAEAWAVPNAANLTALKTADSFSFKCKGDGKTYTVKVGTSDITDYNYHSKTFTAPETETTITISYSDLAQGNWPSSPAVTFNKNNIKHIFFQANSTTGNGPFSITLWDLQVNSGSGVPNPGGTPGKVTITGLGAYNGKYIVGDGGLNNVNIGLLAASTYNASNESGTGGLISNGSVTLNVWKVDDTGIGPFTGNGAGGFELLVFNSAAINASNQDNWQYVGYVLLTFTNGGGSGTFTAGPRP